MSSSKSEVSIGGPPYLSHLLTNPENPVVFMDITLGSTLLGRLKIELFADKVPMTCENFRQFCTGEFKQNTVPKGYKNTSFFKVIHDYMVQPLPEIVAEGSDVTSGGLPVADLREAKGDGGDFVKGNGSGCLSIYGSSFNDENFTVKHSSAGIVTMANTGPDTNGCQFMIITKPCEWLDGKNVAFGTLVDEESQLVLQKMQSVTVNESFVPKLNLHISECGQL